MIYFSALSDRTRLRIVEMLAAQGALSVTEIKAPFPMTLSAISQHLRILREAGLVHVKKSAQQRLYSIDPAALHAIIVWAERQGAQKSTPVKRGALEGFLQDRAL